MISQAAKGRLALISAAHLKGATGNSRITGTAFKNIPATQNIK